MSHSIYLRAIKLILKASHSRTFFASHMKWSFVGTVLLLYTLKYFEINDIKQRVEAIIFQRVLF